MCGICGSTDTRHTTSVSAMTAHMVHRGPDDEGHFTDDQHSFAMAARRLSVIDISGGHQPLSNEDQTVWATLNGEIYNYLPLIDRLHKRGHRFTTACDTEVLVHLYEEYGDDLVHALDGMFAFSLWDTQRARLLLARDRFGEKPLFYHESGGELTYASELTALVAGLATRPEVNAAAVDSFFIFGYVRGPDSIVNGISQLSPGSKLVWRRGAGAEIRRYWKPAVSGHRVAPPFDELVAETETLMEASVRGRMVSDVPLGVLLSGGIDSTLITALATQQSRAGVKTFTVGYEGTSADERSTARRTAEFFGTDHHELVLSDDDACTWTLSMLSSIDQPLGDPALIPLAALAEFARSHVTVALGGEGADELFGGYPRYRWLDRKSALAPHLSNARAAVAERLHAHPDRRARRIAETLAPGSVLLSHVDWVTNRRRHLRSFLYGPKLRSALAADHCIRDLERMYELVGPVAPSDFLMRLDQQDWLPDDVLAKADRAGMSASLEVRTPYLETRLAELANSLPSSLHLSRSGKSLLRSALTRISPQLASRKKHAFEVPASRWLGQGLTSALRQQLHEGALFAEGWLDAKATNAILVEHISGTRDHSAVLWPALALGLWLDRYRSRWHA